MTATVFLYALCSVVAWVTALFAWHRRAQRGLGALTGVMVSIALWGLFSVLELITPNLEAKLRFTMLVNLAGAAAVILMLFFVIQFYQRDEWLTPPRKLALWAPAIVYLGLEMTNPYHRLIWTDFRPGPAGSNITIFVHGPVYYLSTAFQVILALAMFAVLAREAAGAPGIRRRRAFSIGASILTALLPYLFYVAFPEIDLGFDLMPVGLTISGLMLSWTVFAEMDHDVHARTDALRLSIERLESEIGERLRVEQELKSIQDSLALRVAEQSRNLAGIYELVLLAGAVEDLPRLLDESLQRICAALAADAACIHRREPPTPGLRLIAQWHFSPEQRTRAAIFPEGWLAPNDMPRALPDLAAAPLPSPHTRPLNAGIPAALRLPGLASAITAPLALADGYFGVLSVFWAQPGLISVERIELFSALVKQITLLVENIHLRQRIESAAALRERRRLARDLHDSVTQSLHSLNFAAYTASNRLRQGRLNELDEPLRQITDGAAQALKEMRLLLFEMRLAPLESVDLVDALQTRLEAVEKRAGIDAEMLLESPPEWPKAWEREIYCIAMEALNNSLKHAHAAQVRVRMGVSGERFSLEVTDNGQGFDPSWPDRSGMGLRNMAERVERLGGRLHIDAAPGRGSRICVEVILEDRAPEASAPG